MNGKIFPDGQRLLVRQFSGKPLRLFIQALNGGDPVPLNPDIFWARDRFARWEGDRWLGSGIGKLSF